MPSLRARLLDELGGWQTRLPQPWRSVLRGVELDFAGVHPRGSISDGDRVWPQSTAGPASAHVFKALRDVAPGGVRVVIFGNDPYTQIDQATGRSFEQGDLTSWRGDFDEISPSLKSILCGAAATDRAHRGYELAQASYRAHRELRRCVEDDALRLPSPRRVFGHWARQGVLWLNRSLTYTRWDDDHRNSHRALWRPFIDRVIAELVRRSEQRRPVLFVLWGGKARELERVIARAMRHAGSVSTAAQVVRALHPQYPGNFFRTGNTFTDINQRLPSAARVRWT